MTLEQAKKELDNLQFEISQISSYPYGYLDIPYIQEKINKLLEQFPELSTKEK